jgi:hypothetical protein
MTLDVPGRPERRLEPRSRGESKSRDPYLSTG